MTEVTIDNFDEFLPIIKAAIGTSSFVALDCEFTGIKSVGITKSLSDSPEERYLKSKQVTSQFLICQIGLSVFEFNKEQNTYTATSFSFYLFPRTFGAHDTSFNCQASAFEFLSLHCFDFNKFIHDGIPYLNNKQIETIRQHHHHGNVHIASPSDVVRQIDEGIITPACKVIEDWLKHNDDAIVTVNAGKTVLGQYLLVKRIQQRFNNVICSFHSSQVLQLEQYKQNNDVDSSKTIIECYEDLYARLIEKSMGFSKIIEVITKSEKPVVGHNFYIDSLMIFDKFHNTLPDSYSMYKKELHKLFPVILDTKYISFQLRRMFRDVDLFGDTSLEGLHRSLSSDQGMFYKLCSPTIQQSTTQQNIKGCDSEQRLHDAGYDAFLTGYVLIRMAHIFASRDISSDEMTQLSWLHLYVNIKQFANNINLGRAAVKSINLVGSDPVCEFPVEYLVTLKSPGTSIDPNEVVQQFLGFGAVDCHVINHSQAIVSVFRRPMSRNIVKGFQRHRHYTVVKYNRLLNSPKAKRIWCGIGVVICSVVIGGVIYYVSAK